MESDNPLFYMDFEERMQLVQYLHNRSSPETQPYLHKYEARKVLAATKPRDAASKALVDYHLGLNYFETEETSQGNVAPQ